MNERIRQLMIEAGYAAPELATRGQKLAELIVRECAGLCDKAAEENARTFYTVTETQEVGPALVSKGAQVQAEKLSRQIKEHFGVSE